MWHDTVWQSHAPRSQYVHLWVNEEYIFTSIKRVSLCLCGSSWQVTWRIKATWRTLALTHAGRRPSCVAIDVMIISIKPISQGIYAGRVPGRVTDWHPHAEPQRSDGGWTMPALTFQASSSSAVHLSLRIGWTAQMNSAPTYCKIMNSVSAISLKWSVMSYIPR